MFTRKRRAVWGVAAVCLSAVACASAPPASPDLAEVAAIERERFAALVRHDVEALQAMLADDLLYCHSSGLCDTKAQFIESIRSGRRHYVGIEVTDIRPRAIGDVVIVNGNVTMKGLRAGQTVQEELSYTNVHVKRDGRWQLTAWQSTVMRKP